jgi:hypothetical protein
MLEISKEQFEKLLDLHAIKDTFRFYKDNPNILIEDDYPDLSNKRWIKYSGIVFVVKDE